ncbi:MAG: extensin family protein [Pseudolabrys sp.]|nr:extensin family protein [Pseudolabrys sp.]
MKFRGRVLLLAGLGVLLALAGCGRSMMLQGERAPWRHQAEAQCMQSGAVKVGGGVVAIQPIEGPGMCGADFPLKVAALGESPRMSYSDVPRPPGSVSDGSQPNWPPTQARYAPSATQPAQGAQLRWTPGPPSIAAPDVTAPNANAPQTYEPRGSAPAGRPISIYAPGVAEPDDIPDDAVLPQRAPPQRMPPAYNAPVYVPPPQQQRQLPALGPMRGPQVTGAITPAAVTPPATLSCPIVSALDRWVSEGVQPAAMRWFGAQVTEIKQISAYSCRGMVGAGTSHVSEHAFGNALDVAGFTLADGRKISVQNGWRGSPEEQGFLHDVQLSACDMFTTVLAPGYNAAHYNHIHVDLMRRASGRRPCRPDAIPGEVVAARARAVYASKHGTTYTGSIATKSANAGQKPGQVPAAVPGADGLDDEADDTTGSIASKSAVAQSRAAAGEDGEFDDEDVTGSIGAKPATGWPRLAPSSRAPRYRPDDNPAGH